MFLEYKRFLLVFLIFTVIESFGVSFGQQKVTRFLDSADIYYASNPNLSLKFLDSIPEPISVSLKGKLAEFYNLKGFVYYELDNIPKTHQNFLLAIEAAEDEKEYDLGGKICIEIYNIELDSEVENRERILEKARYFFTKSNNQEGLLEVDQQYANAAFSENKFKDCIRLSLALYKDTKRAKNQYLHMITTFMLSSSYFNLFDLKNGEKYQVEFEKLKGKKGIAEQNFYYYIAFLHYDKAIYFYKKKNAEAAKIAFKKVYQYEQYYGISFKKLYYELGIDIYKLSNENEISSLYKDSLLQLREFENANISSENFNSNNYLLDAKKDLNKVNNKKNIYLVNILLLILALGIIISLLFIYRKKIRSGISSLNKKTEEVSSLKKEHQKLSVKIGTLEEYISELSTTLKELTKTESIELQREKLGELNKEVTVVSNTLLNLDNVKLMSSVNEEFFHNIQKAFPDLTESETLTCYYLYLGMKNKEIAAYMKITIRAVESSRYRISKKMDLAAKEISVADYIKEKIGEEVN